MNAVKRGRFISPTKNAELLLFNRIQTVKYLRVYGIYLVKEWPQLLKSSNYTYKTAATPFFIVLELSVTQLQNSIVCTTVVCTYSNLMPCPSFYRSSIILDLLQRAKSFGHGPQTKIIILKRKVNFDIDQNYLDQPKIFLTLGSSCVPSVTTLSVYFPHKQHLSSSKTVKCQRNSL